MESKCKMQNLQRFVSPSPTWSLRCSTRLQPILLDEFQNPIIGFVITGELFEGPAAASRCQRMHHFPIEKTKFNDRSSLYIFHIILNIHYTRHTCCQRRQPLTLKSQISTAPESHQWWDDVLTVHGVNNGLWFFPLYLLIIIRMWFGKT